jgi:hypothetical protein
MLYEVPDLRSYSKSNKSEQLIWFVSRNDIREAEINKSNRDDLFVATDFNPLKKEFIPLLIIKRHRLVETKGLQHKTREG